MLRIAPYGTGAENDLPEWYRTLDCYLDSFPRTPLVL